MYKESGNKNTQRIISMAATLTDRDVELEQGRARQWGQPRVRLQLQRVPGLGAGGCRRLGLGGELLLLVEPGRAVVDVREGDLL
jgi:hypothetical protein